MDSLVYNTPMALQFVPILLSVLLAIVGATFFVIGRGWTATEPSLSIALAGICLTLLAAPASRMSAASAAVLLVIAGFAVLTAALTMILGLSVLAYSR